MKVFTDVDEDELVAESLKKSIKLFFRTPLLGEQADEVLVDSMLDTLWYYSSDEEYWDYVTSIGDAYLKFKGKNE